MENKSINKKNLKRMADIYESLYSALIQTKNIDEFISVLTFSIQEQGFTINELVNWMRFDLEKATDNYLLTILTTIQSNRISQILDNISNEAKQKNIPIENFASNFMEEMKKADIDFMDMDRWFNDKNNFGEP